MGKTWNMHQHFKAELLHRIHSPRRSPRFLPKDRGSFQDFGQLYCQFLPDPISTTITYISQALANAGIVPSSTATYTAAAIQKALTASFGYAVTIQCASGALDEIWYSFDVLGSVQTGTFEASAAVGQTSSCSSTGIKYLPKSGGGTGTTTTSTTKTSTTTTTTSPTSTPTGGGGSFTGSGYLNAYTGGSQDGCLISSGTWYTSGTCATYTATASGNCCNLPSNYNRLTQHNRIRIHSKILKRKLWYFFQQCVFMRFRCNCYRIHCKYLLH